MAAQPESHAHADALVDKLARDGKKRVTYQSIHVCRRRLASLFDVELTHSNHVQITIGNCAKRIKEEFKSQLFPTAVGARKLTVCAFGIACICSPDLIIAIGGGGFFPARVLRTFLKTGPTNRNIVCFPFGLRDSIRLTPSKIQPIQAIGLSLYEELGLTDATGTAQEEKIGVEVVRTQWLDSSTLGSQRLVGRRILIVDEVDDSRTTLGYAVTELQRDIDAQFSSLSEEEKAKTLPTKLAVFVVNNKLRPKLASLPADVPYFSGEDVEDAWICFPWESEDILLHDRIAARAGELGLY